ncbi:MAG TPA: methyltransferase [Planctomycetota bacterium]|nr:methyltransferase [Planctomycetota bacterium]
MSIPAPASSSQRLFHLDRCGDLCLLRRAFEAAGLAEEAVARTLLADRSGKVLDAAAALRRTADPTPVNTLLRLFVLARHVPEATARAALAPADLDALVASGLLRREAEGIRAGASLMPEEDLLIARDFWPDFTGRPMRGDYVLGVGPATRTTAALIVRRPVAAALDLGTGGGYLALLAARHAERVVATDINARALAFAELSAALNGLTNVELRRGSLYEPAAGETFDLLISNPPFVISPESRYDYRDGGLPGDALAEQVVRGAPAHLREGGYAAVILDWYHPEDDWAERPRQWVAGAGCDAWILRSGSADPVAYAAQWLHPEARRGPEDHARQLDEWLAYYERLGIRAICSGAILLRRRSGGNNWVHAGEGPQGETSGSCGEQIERIFAAHALLHGLRGDLELLDRAYRLTPDHQLEHILQAENGRWVIRSARLTQRRGLPYIGNVDPYVSTLLAGCDGQRPLRALVGDLARTLRADPDKLASSVVAVFRKLLETGFLAVT